MTDAELIEHISYDDALKARDMVAPIPTHIDVFMKQNGWKQDPVGFGYSRPKHIPTTQPGGDTGCAFKCMDCGAGVPDLGPMKTPYKCDDCKRPLFAGTRTLWCLSCGFAHDVTPVGTPPERCHSCSAGGEWSTRDHRFVVDRAIDAMFAYVLAGSEEGARELLAGIDGKHAVKAPCTACGEPDCTKNHSEFT